MKIVQYLLKNPLSLIGIVLLLFFVLVAVFAPIIATPEPFQMSPYETPRTSFWVTPEPMSKDHIFGTTQGQYDIFYGLVWGTRTAFKVGLGVVLISSIFGITVGSIAAYYGGIIDEILMRIVDVFMAVPFLIAAMVLTTLLGKGIGPMMIALTAFGWSRPHYPAGAIGPSPEEVPSPGGHVEGFHIRVPKAAIGGAVHSQGMGFQYPTRR